MGNSCVEKTFNVSRISSDELAVKINRLDWPLGIKARAPLESRIIASSVYLYRLSRVTMRIVKSVLRFETENFGMDGVRNAIPCAAKACISVAKGPSAISPTRLGDRAGCSNRAVSSEKLV